MFQYQVCLNLKTLKKTLIFFFLMSLIFSLSAQVNYEQMTGNENSRPRNFEEYLVQTAWMNTPENRVVEKQKAIAEIQQKEAKWNWVDDVNANLNINPTNNIITVNGNEFFQPGVTYGLGLNLGGILTTGFERKVAAEKVDIAQAEINQQKLAIRAAVLKAYQQYKLANEILESRYQAEEDATAAYTIISEKFKKNRAEVEEYTTASSSYFSAKERRQIAETEIELAIIDLEELIGIDWETAVRFEKVYGEKN